MSVITGAVAIIAGLFTIGAVVIAAATHRMSDRDAARVYWRYYLSELGIVGAVVVPLVIHPRVFTLVLTCAAARWAWETFRVFEPLVTRRDAIVCVGLALVSVILGGVTPAGWLLAGALMLFVIVTLVMARREVLTALPMRAWLITLAPLACAAHIAHLANQPSALAWLLFLFITVEMQDAFAWLSGRLFGRRLLFPRISPRKTWAGAIGGAAIGIGVGTLVAQLMLGTGWGMACAIAAIVVVAGFAGDVGASLIKRRAGVKDFPAVSRLHGGLVDIYDSTMFASVALTAILLVAFPGR